MRGVARAYDRKVISAIIHVIRYGLMWRDAPACYGPHKTLYWSQNPCAAIFRNDGNQSFARLPESWPRQTHLSLSRLCAETPSTASRSGGRCRVPFPANGRGIGGTGPIRRASGQARNAVRARAPNASPG